MTVLLNSKLRHNQQGSDIIQNSDKVVVIYTNILWAEFLILGAQIGKSAKKFKIFLS